MGLFAGALGFLHDRGIRHRRVTALASAIAPLLPKSARVLDVGCGDGLLARSILEKRPDVRIEGVDVLVRPGTPIPVREFNGTQLPFGDGEFDAAMAIDVFHHAADANALMGEMKRVTRGLLVVKDHLLHGLPSALILRGMDWVGNFRYGVRLPFSYWSEAEWKNAWDRSGVRQVSMTRQLDLYPFPLSLVFERDLHFLATLESTTRTERRHA
ncbi:MAG: methyltransferase domain-containing protein [Gemmatimonadales bacterium]